MRGLSGKRVLVAGGTSGIGLATAKRFLEEGSRVHVCGVEAGEVERALADLAPFGAVSGGVCDVSVVDEVKAMVDRAADELGGLDVLANNAGIAGPADFLQLTPKIWDRMMAVNVRGVFLVGQAVAKRLVAAGAGGAIVNMSSTNGLTGGRRAAHYGASKAAVINLTQSMARELAQYGIRVNALCPGFIRTPLTERLNDASTFASYASQIPLGRVGEPDDVAAAYAFLASDDARFVTGAVLVIDGGNLW